MHRRIDVVGITEEWTTSMYLLSVAAGLSNLKVIDCEGRSQDRIAYILMLMQFQNIDTKPRSHKTVTNATEWEREEAAILEGVERKLDDEVYAFASDTYRHLKDTVRIDTF